MLLAYVDMLPVLFIATLGVVVVGSGLVANATGRRRVGGWIALGCGIAYSVVFWATIWTFTNVRRQVSVSASWHFEQWGNRRLVVVDAGSPYGGFELESAQLERYLDKVKPPTIRVTVPCYYNFGVLAATGVPEDVDGIRVKTLTDGESPPQATQPAMR